MNKDRVWLLVIILIGFALRLLFLGEQSLWYDEAITWLLSQKSLPNLIQWTAADIQPPFYYLLLWLSTRLLGTSEWALRFPSVLFNILTLPLIYLLSRRLISQSNTSKNTLLLLLATLLFTLSPLMVYYSQEARMYTLLLLLATLTSYLLLNILHSKNPHPSSLILYPLFSAAALYTHYFAAFLLIVHALYALIILWRRRWQKMLVIRLLSILGLIAILYLPWVTTLLYRLGDDPSYWVGALKLNEALRKIIITFTVGETIFENTGWWLAIGYGLIFLVGILAGGYKKLRAKPANYNVLFLLLWLLVPITLILILSYQSPKFNPRYTMLSYPAFVLLLTLALTQLFKSAYTFLRLTFYAALLFIFTTYTFSLYNWFTVIDFSKDDFKALAQFVKERQTPTETVLLSSGHMFPVWAYYYGEENWTPLPQMERLDVNRVTTLDIADSIAPAVNGKTGVWLVTWQDEVIDPNSIVPFWLDQIGTRPNDAGYFWGVGLEHWQLNPHAADGLQSTPIKQPAAETGYNFANKIDLLGMTQLTDTEIALFWRPRQTLSDNLVVTLKLTDNNGFDWDTTTAIGRPAYVYPPSRWPIGSVVMTRHTLPWQTGTPPGAYIAEVGVSQTEQPIGPFVGWDILDAQGRPLRRTALLGPITLTQPIQNQTAFESTQPPLADLSPIITLHQSTLSAPTAEPGDRLLLQLLWQTGPTHQPDFMADIELVDSTGAPYLLAQHTADLSLWQPDDVMLSQHWLNIPPEAAPGPATVQLNNGDTFPIGSLDIAPTERNFTPPEHVDIPLVADFSGAATLLGVNCSDPCRTTPGEFITLTLYWRAENMPDTPYTIFTHLLGPDEIVLVNADHAPTKPTSAWIPNEIIADTITLNIPADLLPGNYALEIGLYDAADPAYQRLPLNTGDTRILLPQFLTIE